MPIIIDETSVKDETPENGESEGERKGKNVGGGLEEEEKMREPPYKYAMLQLTYSPSVHNTFMDGGEGEAEGEESTIVEWNM